MMDQHLERQQGTARLGRWLGILGVPTGPVMGLGLLLGLLGFALNYHLWEQGAHRADDALHAYVRRSFAWCLAAVTLPMLMMIGGGLWYVINHPESTKDALLTTLM